MDNKIIIIKLGGSVLESKDTSLADVAELKRRGYCPVLVHGGAAKVSEWMKRLNLEPKVVNGERLTDEPALEVVAAVLAGLVNKEIVATLLALGVKAAGISGVDGALVEGRMRSGGDGYAGEPAKVNTAIIDTLLKDGFVPVIAPVSLNSIDRPEKARLLLNINGDPFAGALAAALASERLIYLTDVPGIKGADGRWYRRLTASEARTLIDSGVASGGMVPKLRAGLSALSRGVRTSIINGNEPHILIKEIDSGGAGTEIVS